MSRPLFMFRPNLQNEDHRRAWALLQAVPEGQKSAFLVKAILATEQQRELEATLRRILREELQAVPSQPVRQPEEAIPPEMLGFLNFALAKAAVTYGLDLMLAVFRIVQGMVSTIITQSGLSGSTGTTLPQEIIDKINDVGFWDSIPLWAVTLLGGLFITVLSFIMILTVYSRMFKLYMYTAIAPVPLSSFAGEPTSNVGKNFLRSYAGVCLEGAIIALACIIFSVMATSPPAVDPNVSAVTAVWSYVGELIFNLLVLVGAVRMSDRIVKEILGL